MSELIVFCLAAVLAPIIVMVTMVGIGGVLFLMGQLFHYFKDLYHERRASRR